jgi:hypothetical protein
MTNLAVFGTACLLILHCTGNGLADAGFVALWRIENEAEEPLSCDALNADHVRFEITDANKVSHIYRAPCENMQWETDDWEIAVGPGTVAVSIRTDGDLVIASADPIGFDFVLGKMSNRLPDTLFVITDEMLDNIRPSITVSTELQDVDGNRVSCESAGISYFSFTLTDSTGRMFELGDAPCDIGVRIRAKLNSFPSKGAAELEIAFRSATFFRVSQTTVKVDMPNGDAVFGPIPLRVTPRTLTGNAGILWTWTLDGKPLDSKTCTDLGIDYAALFVWDDLLEFWWTDPKRLVLPCAAFDHADDDSLFGEDEYSGFYIPNFGGAGEYSLFLGFYRQYKTDPVMNTLSSDDLVAYDDAYPGKQGGLSGILLSNDETSLGVNQMNTELDANLSQKGTVIVSLSFELNKETGEVGSCPQKPISEMGFLLNNAAGPATSLRVSQTFACQDAVSYWDLPIVERPYTLVTYGMNDRGIISWYGVCDGLVPEIDTGLSILPHPCILSLIELD